MFDDIYRQTANEETADHFHHTMNNVHPILKFEMEKPETTPNSLSLSLLDFTISKDGNKSFEFLEKKKKKTAKEPLFVHHQSAIPKKSKINFIRNERKSIEDRCSSQISATQHLNTFDDILRITVIQRVV